MWGPWTVALTLGFFGTMQNGDYGLSVVLGIVLVANLAGAAYLGRIGKRPLSA